MRISRGAEARAMKPQGSLFMPPSSRHWLIIEQGRKKTPFCHVRHRGTRLEYHVTKGPRRLSSRRV